MVVLPLVCKVGVAVFAFNFQVLSMSFITKVGVDVFALSSKLLLVFAFELQVVAGSCV